MKIVWSKLLDNADKVIKLLGGLIILLLALWGYYNHTLADEYLTQVNTIRETHTKELNSNGDTVYITKQEYYTKNNLRDSKDPVIISLLKEFDNLKLRKVEQIFKTNAHTNIKYITDITRDTVLIIDSIYIPIKEYDTYDNGILSMERYVDSINPNIAHYKYDYNPTISGAISWEKEGKWHINNIWSWRPKVWRVNLVSNDTNMIIENSKFIYVGKKKN